ncbi:antibiotic biosynthesis monooxygenase [Jonesia denitrificans]|nr:putative quinol monooxygenase [Jonesia denitrificans]ASE10055.1 antibiotic biosynthesis monooxygenase [Jonesia denitrificans]QXB44672.1 antibiotic biosynthesis monooxygenase [Jonesia denitrificans]
MTYATIGTMGVKPGERDAVIEIMTRHNSVLRDAGCLVYEVGGRDDDPDTVYVAEVWESEEAHAASLELDEVKAVISDAMPHLTGDFGGYDFAVAGSPLRD